MQHLVLNFGALAIFFIMVAEAACAPIPSEVVMIFGGALAGGAMGGHHPSLAAVIAAGAVGNVLGSYVAWAIGRYGGRPLVERWGRYIRIRERHIERANVWFTRRGAASVLFGRMIPVVRTFVSLPAGFTAMPPLRFGLLTLGGCLPWCAALAGIGYAIGANWHSAASIFHNVSYGVIAFIALAVVVTIAVLLRRRRNRSRRQALESLKTTVDATQELAGQL